MYIETYDLICTESGEIGEWQPPPTEPTCEALLLSRLYTLPTVPSSLLRRLWPVHTESVAPRYVPYAAS
jgi:hypothetical protein